MVDIMSAEKRSALMSRIRGKNTGVEKELAAILRRNGYRFEKHARDLEGRPDIVFRSGKVAVFIEGDFWHGWHFNRWQHKLTPEWKSKIAANRRRDTRNHSALRRRGWKVIRVWEHQLLGDPGSCLERIAHALMPPQKKVSRRSTKSRNVSK